ncbi:MAG TPA: flagellar biosynthesis protein FlhB [Chromatiales bacterium]|nr:flagellar biosynthesis protein FlhB [Thiotrichales bacterium]HIP68522.1 flagellar biosynthesis protein FlhB [Chromatiales bacterium]
MAEQNSGQERTEQPTEKRLKDSREKGQVPRSRELNTMVVMLASAMGLFVFGGSMGEKLMRLISMDLHLDRRQLFDKGAITEALATNVLGALAMLAPFLVLMMVAAFVGPLMMSGWSFSAKALTPKLDKLNPLKGMKRVFGVQGLVELLKALAKFLLLGSAALLLLHMLSERYITLGQAPLLQGIQSGMQLILLVFLVLALTLGLVAAIDVPYQKWTHMKKLRMTVQEVKQESKETEGNPEVRGKVRSLQQQMAQRRMLQEVPDADVIIVNPTHFSVALRYDEANQQAPRVVAKGVDFLALKIREIATAHDVPIFSAPPLSRALYHHTEIDQEIPAELYLAIAQILAYVYQLENSLQGEGPAPEKPTDLQVPEKFHVPEET